MMPELPPLVDGSGEAYRDRGRRPMTQPGEGDAMPQFLAVRELTGNPVPHEELPQAWRENACSCGCPVRSVSGGIGVCFRCGDLSGWHPTACTVPS